MVMKWITRHSYMHVPTHMVYTCKNTAIILYNKKPSYAIGNANYLIMIQTATKYLAVQTRVHYTYVDEAHWLVERNRRAG